MKPEIISSCQIILGNSYPCFNKQLFFKPWDLAASTAGFRRDSALLFDHAWVSWLSKSTVARYGPPMIPSDIGALPTEPTGAPQHLVWHIVDKDVWYLQELDEVGEHWVFSLWASFIFGWDHQEKTIWLDDWESKPFWLVVLLGYRHILLVNFTSHSWMNFHSCWTIPFLSVGKL